jgi:cytochrome P450
MSKRAPVTDWTSDFDHLDPRWVADPYSIWQELRQTCPVAHTDRFMGVYFPTRYKDIRAIAYDTEHFSSQRSTIREGRPPLPPSPPLTSDPPAHREDRKVLLPRFTPAAVEKLEPRTRALCREALERLSGKSGCDAAVDYAQEIPTRVTARMLGISEHAGELFRRWVQEALELGVADPEIAKRATAEMSGFFTEEIAKRRLEPGDDLVSYLLDVRIAGELLSDERIADTLRLLLLAGITSTWSVIGVSLWYLATHPNDRTRLVAEPELIPTAVEEFVRAFTPVGLGRRIVKDTEIGGFPLKQDEMVLLHFGAANRDPLLFPDADKVIIDRAENRHAGFGLGIHRCIGSTLARMEIRVALEEWLAKFPDFELSPGAVVEWSSGIVRGPRQLPLRLRASQTGAQFALAGFFAASGE